MSPVTFGANLLIVAGLWFAGSRKRWAFLLTAAGEAAWTAYSAYGGMWDLTWICAVFTVIGVVNFVRWGKASAAESCPVCGAGG